MCYPLADTGLMLSQFRDTLAEIPTADLTLESATAANANLRSVSITGAEARNLTQTDVATFLQQAADSFGELLTSSCSGADAIFYAWVDEMAGQLRFSVASSMPPPFACSIRIVNDPEIVAQHFINCPHLEGIPFLSLESADASSVDSDDEPHVLDVFVTHLPRNND